MMRGWRPEDDLAAEIMERGRMEGEYHEADTRETTSNDPSLAREGEEDHERVEGSGSGGRGVHPSLDHGVHGAPGTDDEVTFQHIDWCTVSWALPFNSPGCDCPGSDIDKAYETQAKGNYNEEFYEEDFRQQNELGLL